MKRLQLCAAILLAGLALACNFTEEIHFNDDGTGKISLLVDADEMMAIMGSMDSTATGEKAIDSTLVFRDLLRAKKDSIAQLSPEEQNKLKKLESFSVHMVMDQQKERMNFRMFRDFKAVSEVNDAFNTFQEASALNLAPGAKGASMKTGDASTKINYAFNGRTFSRTIAIVDQELFKKGLDSLKGAEMFLSGATYTFKYHFPKRVKNVNVEGATFSMDGKTMIYEVNFMEMMKDPESMEIEVELED